MSTDLQRIERALAEISETLQRQSEDIRDLREQIKSLVQVATPASVSVVIDPDCGYEWFGVRIQLDAETWSKVKAGKHPKLGGRVGYLIRTLASMRKMIYFIGIIGSSTVVSASQ